MKPFMRSSKAGFTLVELIVVISILAILAGVAIPVYSGYIKKANEAADQQLLAAVNTAFGAACLENGRDPRSLSAAASLADGKLESVAPYNDSFMRYFAGNENNKFKVFAFLVYNRAEGVFSGYSEGESVSYTYVDSNGTEHTLSINPSDLAKYRGTTFDNLGTATLTNAIDTLATHVATNFTDLLTGENPNPSFIAFLDTLDLGEKEDGSKRTLADLTTQERANAIALWVASESGGIDAATVTAQMASGSQPTLSSESNAVATLAMEYAMLLAYSNTDTAEENPYVLPGGTDSFFGSSQERTAWYNDLVAKYGAENVQITSGALTGRGNSTVVVSLTGSETSISDLFARTSGGTLDPLTLVDVYNRIASTDGFQTYMAGQGASDLDGYLSAMNMINDNTENLDVYQLLNSGFTDQDLNAILALILG